MHRGPRAACRRSVFLTNSECLRSRAVTQREGTGTAVNLSQLRASPFSRNNGRNTGEGSIWRQRGSIPPWAGAAGSFLEIINNREWRIVLFIPSHCIIPATQSPNNGTVCAMPSLHPSPLYPAQRRCCAPGATEAVIPCSF